MINQQLHEKIDAYLNGQMPAPEAASFEADMQADPELAGEVDLHRVGLLATERLTALDMKDKFKRWRTEMEVQPTQSPPQPPPTTKVFPYRSGFFALAAALLLLLTGAFWLWKDSERKIEQERNSRKQTEQALLDAYLRIEEMEAETKRLQEDLQKNAPARNDDAVVGITPTPQEQALAALDLARKELNPYVNEFDEVVRAAKSNAPATNNRLSEANKAIKENRIEDAERILEGIGPADSLHLGALKMLAYVYVQRKKYKDAVTAYQTYLDKSKDSDTDKTDWNRAIFYLADYPNHKQGFQNLLDKMVKDGDHTYHVRALALQKQLQEKGVLPK